MALLLLLDPYPIFRVSYVKSFRALVAAFTNETFVSRAIDCTNRWLIAGRPLFTPPSSPSPSNTCFSLLLLPPSNHPPLSFHSIIYANSNLPFITTTTHFSTNPITISPSTIYHRFFFTSILNLWLSFQLHMPSLRDFWSSLPVIDKGTSPRSS